MNSRDETAAQKLVQAMADMNESDALSIAREMLEGGEDPLTILGKAREAMEIVGERFGEGRYFLPELVMAGEMLSQVSEMTRSKIEAGRDTGERRLEKVVLEQAVNECNMFDEVVKEALTCR